MATSPRLKITCDNGNYTGVQILLDGKPLEHVSEVAINIRAGEFAYATVTFYDVELDILAHDPPDE